MSFYTEDELPTLGLKRYGDNTKISRYARLYNPQYIEIGNHVRIDDFCILSASEKPFVLKDHIHISAGSYLYGFSGLQIESFSNISAGVKLYTVNDDYSGESLIGPTVPEIYRNVDKQPIIIRPHCVVGCNSVLLPGTILPEGVAIGANSLVKRNKHLNEWCMYAGTPLRYIRQRTKGLLNHVGYIIK